MEASLTCAVCLSLFEEPITLPICSHNFCRACLVECLSLTRPTAEPLSSSSSSPRQGPRARSHDLPAQDGEAQGSSGRESRYGGSGAVVTVSCPLCRKVCPLPRFGGPAALPVNTTLAEVVKLFKANLSQPGEGAPGEAVSSALGPQLAALGERCEKHPGRALQLYCRMCCRGGCGLCMSEDHGGIFHSVNLIDTVYQEEKLAFFSNLKKLRTVHLKLMNEITTYSDNARAVMRNEEEVIKTEFEKICNALETRKQQLLEDLKSQKERKEKECQVWKRMKEVHRRTIENVLNDCETLVDECDPQRFLEVACSLNHRMKTQLDLMQMASKQENKSECKQMQVDTTSVVNDILALKLTAVNLNAVKDVPSGDSEHFVFTRTENKWANVKSEQNIFSPVTRRDAILDDGSIISIQSVLTSTGSEILSYEEVRYIHYLAHRVSSDELQTQLSALKEKLVLPKCLSSSTTMLEEPPSFVSAEANNHQKALKMSTLQRHASESSFSNSLGFTFSTPPANLNFSFSNNFNVKKSHKVSRRTSLLANTVSSKPATIAPPCAVTCPFETQPSFLALSAPPSATAINLHAPGDDVQHPAPPVLSSSGTSTSYTASKGSTPSFKTNNPFFTIFVGKHESQDYNFNNINGSNASTIAAATSSSSTTTTTDAISFPPSSLSVDQGPCSTRGKSYFSDLSTSSQSSPFQTATLNSSQFSIFPAIQKTMEENKASSFPKKPNLEHSWFIPPAVSKQLGNSSCIANVSCKSASCAFEKADASKKQSVPGSLSPNNCWASNIPFLFTFKGNNKNSCDPLTSSTVCFNETENVPEEKDDPPKSAVSSKNDDPVDKEFKNLCSSSFSFPMGKCQKSETESTVSPQQNVAHGTTATSALVSPNLPGESHFPLEDPSKTEDDMGSPSLTNGPHCVSNADSDVEDHPASSSSDSSCTSEYFSVAEDEVLPS